MSDSNEVKQHLLDQLPSTHGRFAEIMEERLAHATPDDVERYFGVLSNLVAKLEDDDKTLRDVMAEMVADALPMVMADLAN